MKSLRALSAPLSILLLNASALAETEVERLQSLCRAQATQIASLESALVALQSGTKRTVELNDSNNISKQNTVSTAKQLSAVVHKVKSGESLTKISNRYGVSLQTLAKLNGIKTTSVIHPGQRLKISSAASQSSAKSSPQETDFHIVMSGDTCSSISKKYRVQPEALLSMNPGLEPTKLQVGQKIQLVGGAKHPTKPVYATKPEPRPAALTPSHSMTIATASATKAPATPATAKEPSKPLVPTPEQTASTSPKPESTPTPIATTEQRPKSIVIENEISYGDFAAKHGTDPERLNDLNGLDLASAAVLARGSELYVPAQP